LKLVLDARKIRENRNSAEVADNSVKLADKSAEVHQRSTKHVILHVFYHLITIPCHLHQEIKEKVRDSPGIAHLPNDLRASAPVDLSDDSTDSRHYSTDFCSSIDELAICGNDRFRSSDRVGRRHHRASMPPTEKKYDLRAWWVMWAHFHILIQFEF
jgi:hypothetical protein